MSNQQDEQELETVSMNEYVDLGEALDRLEKNPDFQLVITKGYMEKSVLESVSLLGHHDIKKQGLRPEIMEDLVAASNLGEHFRMIKNFYAGAVQDLDVLDPFTDTEV